MEASPLVLSSIWGVRMNSVGPLESLIMIVAGLVSLGVPVATLVFVILIYRNTRK